MTKEEERQRIGQRIGALRYQKGITQQALADMTGLQRIRIDAEAANLKVDIN